MIIEATGWAPNRATMLADFAALSLLQANVALVEVGELPGIAGWHFNLRFYGQSALNLLSDTPDHADYFERYKFRELVDERTGEAPEWMEIPGDPVPVGYAMPSGTRLFDPSLISSRRSVWA
jgi:hypothetical protein